jgi:2-polyprenyl-3-methyl-5-hydroxy-6-metoxy-1,4-benzoquinol methylase
LFCSTSPFHAYCFLYLLWYSNLSFFFSLQLPFVISRYFHFEFLHASLLKFLILYASTYQKCGLFIILVLDASSSHSRIFVELWSLWAYWWTSKCQVLEIGCGNSRLSIDMFRDAIHNITCSDLSPIAVQKMRKQLEAAACSGVSLHSFSHT